VDQLDEMRIFLRVAELASFTQAAAQLGLPKASVSGAVQHLENRLGVRLLQRTTRRVQLTRDGQAYYERSRDLLADMEELHTLFHQDATQLSGRLRVDMPASLARLALIPLLPDFLARHPGLALELGCNDRRVDLVQEGFDCVIRVGALVDSSLVARPLGLLRQINCASPAYLARHGQPRCLEDLAGHRLIQYQPVLGGQGAEFEYLDATGQRQALPMPAALTVNATDAYARACLAGLGIIQSPAAGLQTYLAEGRLVEILPEHQAPPLPVHLLYPNRRHLPRRVQAFMGWVAEALAGYLQT
jgi:DNA-binding transcriptional LysR family regulator